MTADSPDPAQKPVGHGSLEPDWEPEPLTSPGPDYRVPRPRPAEQAPVASAASDGSPRAVTSATPGEPSRELNSRAVIGMALSAVAAFSVVLWFAAVSVPIIISAALAVGGIVMGLRGRAAARQGRATNGGLGLAAAILGAVAVAGIVAVYALILYALSVTFS